MLLTDHQPLEVIFGSQKAVPMLAAARRQRWSLVCRHISTLSSIARV